MLIPAYDAAGFLPRLLGSAKAQTIPFDEIWVHDDCSTDDTAAVAERFGAFVVRSPVNVGCSRGKNVLAGRTECEWLHFHDADDELYPNFVEAARRAIENDNKDVVLFAYEERDDASGRIMDHTVYDAAEIARDARRYAIIRQINPFCGLYRRSAFLRAGGYDEDPLVLHNEDVALHIRLAFAGLSFAARPEVTVINHRRADSMSAANGLKCARSHYHVMRKTVGYDRSGTYARDIARRLWVVAGVLAGHLDFKTADAAARLAMRLGGPKCAPTGRGFKAMCRLSPALALRVREYAIRALKPRLRVGLPGWRLRWTSTEARS